MKRVFCIIPLLAVFVMSMFSAPVFASQFDDDTEYHAAVDWMFAKGLTKYQDYNEFRPGDILTREEASKFFTEFSMNILLQVIDMAKYCEFDDLEEADPTLRNSILQSCLLNLFYGSAGKFFPHRQLTKAQALTVLMRALEGNQPEDIEPWWYYYHARALEIGLTSEQNVNDLDKPVTRYEMALLLYRAAVEVADGE
ncbi:MAG: hypothetical protein H6765_04365 [Candidatus Peribacteria bacterium]|nr:MAG: hypothetical protein H6765_04365 [Candidatus Peribacteria bacterium]